MKKLILFVCAISLVSLSVIGQDKAKEKKGVKSEGAHQAEYNANTQERDHAAEIDSRNATKGSQDQNTSDVGEEEANEESNDTENETNTAGVPSRDVSSSGSPGMATEDEALDGTNTMQRAKLNTAGSPIPGSRAASVRTSDNRKSGSARANESATKAKQPQAKESKTDTKGKKKKPA